jgi:hypothetical protein
MAINRNLSILAQGAGSNQTLTLTNSQANALTVGRQGATNPVLNVDASTASVVTGLNLKGAAAAGGMALSVTSSGTNENLTIDAKGSGTVTLNATGTGSVLVNRLLDISASTAGQIKFPATQNASADANTLDDYEEGTWTPVIAGSGGSPHSGYIVQVGNYTKTGRQVVANLYVRNSGALSGPTGSVWISGLPFTSANTNVGFGGAVSFYQVITMSVGHTQLLLNVIANTTNIEVNTSGSAVGYANQAVSGWSASGLVGGSVLYNT